MTNEEAIDVLKNDIEICTIQQKQACDMAIQALQQTERIERLVSELHLADVSSKDFDNMFYLQSVNEIKEEMWQMYCFAEDVRYTLMLESEE